MSESPETTEQSEPKSRSITLLSFRGYASHRGVSVEAVSQAVKAGRIETLQDGEGRRWIHPDIADAQWERRSDPSKMAGAEAMIRMRKRVAGSDDSAPVERKPEPESKELAAVTAGNAADTYAIHRAERERHQAELKRLEVERRAGELIPAADVQREAFACARTVRDALLGIPDRLAAELAGENDLHKVHARLLGEIRQALTGLANG